MSTENGGSAFPLPLGTANCSEPEQSGGMSLRDWFAGKALHGELASQSDEGSCYSSSQDCRNLAEWCYDMADAMLAERAK